MAKHGRFRNAGEYALAWPLLKAVEWLPLSAARRLSAAVLRLTYYLTPHWRRVADRNLEMALPDVSDRRRGEIVLGVYDSLGRALLSLARMPRLNAANIREWIDYDGFEHFEQALRGGRGVLFMTAHLGNWELSAVSHALFGHPMHVMVRTLDNPFLDRLVDRYRTLCGNRTIRKQDFGRSLLQALRDNEAVGILIDQNVSGDDALFVDFFGIPASATDGLAKIAMRTGAPVIPGFALWNPAEQRYVLKFYPVLEMVSTGDAERDLLSNTQRCQRMLEQVIREHPEQWLWIHRRWKTRPAGERPLYGDRSPGSPASA